MAFALAARIGVVAIDGPCCRLLHLIRFDSLGVGSEESPYNFRFMGLQRDII